VHWSEGWTYFSLESNERLRYLSVFAMVSQDTQKASPAEIDFLRVREGYLRPADAASKEESLQFKTAEEEENSRQLELSRRRAKYPMALRSLLEAEEAPDDSDHAVLKEAIERVRENPDQILFQQILEWLHTDAVRFGRLLETLLREDLTCGARPKPWAPEKRRRALIYVANALPMAKSQEALQTAAVILLKSIGGGKLKVQSNDGTLHVEVSRESELYDSQNVNQTNLSELGKAARDMMIKRIESAK
jgi:hypothetical protein